MLLLRFHPLNPPLPANRHLPPHVQVIHRPIHCDQAGRRREAQNRDALQEPRDPAGNPGTRVHGRELLR